MIDTHSHLLPGLDDGAQSVEQSVAMARELVKAGVREVVCTPHLRSPTDPAAFKAEEALDRMRRALTQLGIHLQLQLGYELAFSFVAHAPVEELRRFVLGSDGNALLVEVPHVGWPPFAEEALFRLRLAGFLPVLAHPERNERIQKDHGLLGSLLRLGVVAQGTTSSLIGYFGSESRRTLFRHLAAGELALLASDAHYNRRRSWDFALMVSEIRRHMPEADLQILMADNPARLLRGEPLRPLPPVPQRRSWRRYVSRPSARLR